MRTEPNLRHVRPPVAIVPIPRSYDVIAGTLLGQGEVHLPHYWKRNGISLDLVLPFRADGSEYEVYAGVSPWSNLVRIPEPEKLPSSRIRGIGQLFPRDDSLRPVFERLFHGHRAYHQDADRLLFTRLPYHWGNHSTGVPVYSMSARRGQLKRQQYRGMLIDMVGVRPGAKPYGHTN
jgi:hypothetical protein